ncbi:methyltransferase domain-containing protein [Streptomyces sp. SP17BM10]|uniref:methyltransferase domain-containing protein n=1 Tax=Streptomyces sp. SP17BM10 TaxID=3002530 RepID=UPI002E783934|nr:methyltransferase domain-containing protein [Streptomyces sp. SP17BM10]MEE1781684.1 methyltransferase domain-containing protein [Streptomyces sp. SP17BM10]
MSDRAEPIHARIAELARPQPGEQVVDLGCGAGPTLQAVSRIAPEAALIGLDRSPEFLLQTGAALKDHAGAAATIVADLRAPLPCTDGSVDVVLSYNTIECLPDPQAMLAEVARVLRPGGRAIIAHVDFDSMVIAGADAELDRRVCHAFADDAQSWMDHADGRIGRKLGLLVAGSPLSLLHVEPLLVWSTAFTGHAKDRLGQIRKALLSAARHGRGSVSPEEIEEWYAAVGEADRSGGFFFSELAFIAVAERSRAHRGGGTGRRQAEAGMSLELGSRVPGGSVAA